MREPEEEPKEEMSIQEEADLIVGEYVKRKTQKAYAAALRWGGEWIPYFNSWLDFIAAGKMNVEHLKLKPPDDEAPPNCSRR